jgi:hypothetical protein
MDVGVVGAILDVVVPLSIKAALCMMELPRSLCFLIQQPAQVQLNSAMRHAVINKIQYRKRLQMHETRVPLDHK